MTIDIDSTLLEPSLDGSGEVETMRLDALVRHILDTHHAYVRRTLPLLRGYLAKLVDVHGARHPELATVERTFQSLAGGLEHHSVKEEETLFPYITALARAERGEQPMPANMFGTVRHPIRLMELEHEEAGGEMALIRQLTGGYAPPDDGCATYRVALLELEAFERDLHRHVHLEDNLLFPAALELEQRLLCHALTGRHARFRLR